MTVEQGIAVAKDMIRKMIDQCYLEDYTMQDLKILCTYCDTALDMSFDHDKYTFNHRMIIQVCICITGFMVVGQDIALMLPKTDSHSDTSVVIVQ